MSQRAKTHTYLLGHDEIASAAEMSAALEDHGAGASAPVVLEVDGARHELPRAILAAVAQVARGLADGRPVTVSEQEHLLTPHEAADLLGVGRPELDRMLESSTLPFQTIGRHHRIALGDVLALRRGEAH